MNKVSPLLSPAADKTSIPKSISSPSFPRSILDLGCVRGGRSFLCFVCWLVFRWHPSSLFREGWVSCFGWFWIWEEEFDFGVCVWDHWQSCWSVLEFVWGLLGSWLVVRMTAKGGWWLDLWSTFWVRRCFLLSLAILFLLGWWFCPTPSGWGNILAYGWVATSDRNGVGVVVSVCSGGDSEVRGSVSKSNGLN